MDPRQTRIISAGIEKFKNVFRRSELGTFEPLDEIL